MARNPPNGRRVMPQDGPLSPSVPGFVDGCFALLERFGTRPFAELAAPAIAYAEEGIVVSPAEHLAIENHAERLGRYPASAAIFLPVGRRRDLARSCASRTWPARWRSLLAAVRTRSIAARSRKRSSHSWRRTAAH